MGIPAIMERRSKSRKRLTGLMPGRLSIESTAVDVHCKPVDLSESGLGIVSETPLEVGSILTLHLPGNPITLEVRWSEQDFGRRDLMRYGLELKSHGVNLYECFEECGVLK